MLLWLWWWWYLLLLCCDCCPTAACISHCADRRNPSITIVRFLVANGCVHNILHPYLQSVLIGRANVLARCGQGSTAADYARQWKHDAIAAILNAEILLQCPPGESPAAGLVAVWLTIQPRIKRRPRKRLSRRSPLQLRQRKSPCPRPRPSRRRP